MSGSSKEGDTTWTAEAAHIMKTKDAGTYFDPCQEAAEKTYRCLTRNEGKREFCKDYFDAYKECKKNWITKWKTDRKGQ